MFLPSARRKFIVMTMDDSVLQRHLLILSVETLPVHLEVLY